MDFTMAEAALTLVNRPHRQIIFGCGKVIGQVYLTRLEPNGKFIPSLAFFELKHPLSVGNTWNPNSPDDIASGAAHFIFENKESVEVVEKWLAEVKKKFDV